MPETYEPEGGNTPAPLTPPAAHHVRPALLVLLGVASVIALSAAMLLRNTSSELYQDGNDTSSVTLTTPTQPPREILNTIKVQDGVSYFTGIVSEVRTDGSGTWVTLSALASQTESASTESQDAESTSPLTGRFLLSSSSGDAVPELQGGERMTVAVRGNPFGGYRSAVATEILK